MTPVVLLFWTVVYSIIVFPPSFIFPPLLSWQRLLLLLFPSPHFSKPFPPNGPAVRTQDGQWCVHDVLGSVSIVFYGFMETYWPYKEGDAPLSKFIFYIALTSVHGGCLLIGHVDKYVT